MRVTAFAPGRVNLIGDHTDHTGGLVLPMAIGLGVTVVGERGGDRVVLRSDEAGGTADVPLDVGDPSAVQPGWARYVAGVVAALHPAQGLTGSVSSTLPVGAGLSSSAALTVAVALALGADSEPRALARLGQRAEHEALGVPCGIMDQLVVAAGIEGAALLIDTESLSWDEVRLPRRVDVVVLDSGEPRTLAGSPYGAVRDRCVRAQDELGSLREAPADAWRQVADPAIQSAAHHVISENERVRQFAAAALDGDAAEMGRLMLDSHRSLGLLGVSTPRLDALVAELVATAGVHGARLTGAGFGGCVVALTEHGVLDTGWRVTPSAGAWVRVG